ncbi:hypothetical protein GCM10027169_09500 [Gordonia jinhuaensis]|uniref:Transmembrane protein n=1 Tax=Gordonia jinhuaensis TaxID=1517702 RepID=A0A916SXR0_9ACTN|nr:gephyrin-like molybdotransferase receptor GlpR [Gordonia jinhuaensis]GGB18817.1 hypothetical protein GCM10011489_03660 [Gordonia jinhuaensis]
MPNSVLWICLVVVWLFVLAPMMIKRRPEVRKTTDVALATRVLHRGGKSVRAKSRRPAGRHPHDPDWEPPAREYRKAGQALTDDDDHPDLDDELVAEKDTVATGSAKESTGRASKGSESTARGSKTAADALSDAPTAVMQAVNVDADELVDLDAAHARVKAAREAELDDAAVDDPTVDTHDGNTHDGDTIDAELVDVSVTEARIVAETVDDADIVDVEIEDLEIDDVEIEFVADVTESDLIDEGEDIAAEDIEGDDFDADLDHDDFDDEWDGDLEDEADRDEALDDEARDDAALDDEALDDKVEADTVRPLRNSRRGGYDPEADRRRTEKKYRVRQRTTLGLAALAIIGLALGFVLGTAGWVIGAVFCVVFVGYLAALRRTVRIEQRIRAQRAARAARDRRAQQRRRNEESRADVPSRLRRPGAVVLEIDDEDPAFDHLPHFTARVRRDEVDLDRAVG